MTTHPRLFAALGALLLLLWTLPAHAQRAPAKPGVLRGAVTIEGAEHSWALVIPPGYDPATPAPLHVNLHGGGRRSNENTCLLQWRTPRLKPFLLLCPSFPQGRWWTPEGDATLMASLQLIRERFNIDPDRITLGGMSNGGTGTWHHAIKRPWLWAAIAPQAAPAIGRDDYNRNFAHLPILLIHARDDRQIKIEHSRAMTASLQRLGADIRFIEAPSGGHHFLTAYADDTTAFLTAHTRMERPSFAWTPIPGAVPDRVEWLVGPFTAPVQAQLTTSPGAAAIQVQTNAPPDALTVLLPDALAPEDTRQVTVSINGRQVYAGPPQVLPPDPLIAAATPRRGVALTQLRQRLSPPCGSSGCTEPASGASGSGSSP